MLKQKRRPIRIDPLFCFGGGKGIRTPDPLLAKQMLSQLSYAPTQREGSIPQSCRLHVNDSETEHEFETTSSYSR